MKLSIYRYDPDKDAKPYMKDYDVQLGPADHMLTAWKIPIACSVAIPS